MSILDYDLNIVDKVIVSKHDLWELQRKVQGFQNLHLYLQDRELELRKEKQKAKRLEEILINTHKLLSQKTLKDKSKIRMAAQTSDSEIDYTVGNVPDFDNLVTGGIESGLQTMPETDGEVLYYTSRSAGKSNIVQRPQQNLPVKNFVENLDENESEKHIFNFEEENVDVESANNRIQSDNPTKFIYRSVSENTTQKFPLTDDHMVKSGVSEQYFNNLVKELRITKGLLNELLQNQNIKLTDAVTWKQNKDQQTQIRHLITEKNRIETECENLQSRLEKAHSELCIFKSFLRKEKEGETVHLTTTAPKSFGSRSNSKEDESLNSMNGSEVNSSTGFKIPSDDSGSTVKSDVISNDSVTKSVQIEDSKVLLEQPSQEDQNREKQRMQRELNQMKMCLEMAMNECSKSKQEKDEITKSYTQLHSTLVELRKQKDDTYLRKQNSKLVEESIDLQKKLKELQEDNLDYLSHIETLQNNFTKEKAAKDKIERTLIDEKESHKHTKKELHSMYGDLKKKYDQVFHEKTLLQQQMFEQKSLSLRSSSNFQTLPTSSAASLSVSSLQSAKIDYFDTQRKQPTESANINMNRPEPFRCDRCHSEFDVELEFLTHIQNCLP